MRVYYYYQFVYKLVYYNNKTDNASVLRFRPCGSLRTNSRSKTAHRRARKKKKNRANCLPALECQLDHKTAATTADVILKTLSVCKTRLKPSTLQDNCGKAAAYPQEQMCRTGVFLGRKKFVQVPFKRHTRFVQPVNAHSTH